MSTELDPDYEWWHDANCKDMDPNIFFSWNGGDHIRALHACSKCPVKSECLEYALLRPDTPGIWGGTNKKQRDRIRRQRARERRNASRKS